MTKVVAPGYQEKIAVFRPEPSKTELQKVADGKQPACACGTYPAWYCDSWPRCVSI